MPRRVKKGFLIGPAGLELTTGARTGKLNNPPPPIPLFKIKLDPRNIVTRNILVGSTCNHSNCLFSKLFTSKGVSCGPKITAFHKRILFSPGAPDTPAGGSS